MTEHTPAIDFENLPTPSEGFLVTQFAGLHQLCAPMLDHVERLSGPQRDALGTTFGLSTGDVPERFVVSLAVLNLFSDVASEQPLVCLVDDALAQPQRLSHGIL